MKSFLEEYGFVILIAIVIILLIVMATPIGSTIKASVLGLVDSFGSRTVAKIDKANFQGLNYIIEYHLDGGVNNPSNPITYEKDSGDIVLADPSKEGYTFDG